MPSPPTNGGFWACGVIIEGDELWEVVCSALKVHRLGYYAKINDDDFRTPSVSFIYGDSNPMVHKKEFGIRYIFNINKCMFCPGNMTEKARIAKFDCRKETVVDLFAGIGYFTLVYLKYSNARLVYACEWNKFAVESLNDNLRMNRLAERCVVLPGDCRRVCPMNVADRVNLGLIPSSRIGWRTACLALSAEKGGILHIHGLTKTHGGKNVHFKDVGEILTSADWKDHVEREISRIMGELGLNLGCRALGVFKVKQFAPNILHSVADVVCSPK